MTPAAPLEKPKGIFGAAVAPPRDLGSARSGGNFASDTKAGSRHGSREACYTHDRGVTRLSLWLILIRERRMS